MQILKNQKGFTLVEIILACGLLSVIILLTSGIMLSSTNVYGKTLTLNAAKQLAISSYDFISDCLTYAMDIEIGSDELGYKEGIEVVDGRLYYQSPKDTAATSFYGDDIYNGLQLRIRTSYSGSIMDLTVEVLKNDKIVYTEKSSFKMLNIADAPAAKISGPTDEQIDPKIYFNR